MVTINNLSKCECCELCFSRTQAVQPIGSIFSRVVFVGEAPGENEDIQGQPFIGKAGQIFEKTLLFLGLQRYEIYLTNVVKCRPVKIIKRPGSIRKSNRTPTKIEIEQCYPWLQAELSLLAADLIIPMGKTATYTLCFLEQFKTMEQTISRLNWKDIWCTLQKCWDATVALRDTDKHSRKFVNNVYPIYHPATAVYGGQNKLTYMKQVRKLKKYLEKHYGEEEIKK